MHVSDLSTAVYYTPISTDPQYCKKWYDGMDSVINTKVLYETCTQVWPAYLATITKLDHERIKLIMEKEIPAVVPNFRLKQHESTTTTYSDIKSESYVRTVTWKKRFITD